jgi:uncharacterized membrane protein
VGNTVLATVGSLIIGGVVAVVAVVGLVTSQTSHGRESPTDVTQPVNIDYGTNS